MTASPAVLIATANRQWDTDLRDCLGDAGYEVLLPVRSAADAFEKAERHRPSIVYISKELDGDIDGISAAGFLSRISSAPVVFFADNPCPGVEARMASASPFGYISMPCHPVEIRTVTRLTLHLSRRFSSDDAMVPICASCKSIRTLDDTWLSLERYFEEQRRVQFTHAICPDCAGRLYPEFVHHFSG